MNRFSLPMAEQPDVSAAVHRISVIIRCHQQGRFLAEAVDSARHQSRPPDEIVVVNDGSTDETARVLDALQESGPLIVVTHPKVCGPAESFNAGVRASTGTLVLGLDADDALSWRYIELTEKALLTGADLAYGGVERFGAESSYEPARPFAATELGVENFLHVSTLFKRSLFEASGGFRAEFDELGLEDWEFWLSAVEHGAKGQAVSDCWIRYRRHVGGSRNRIRRRDVLRVHLRVHSLHPDIVRRRHLARWALRSLWRNVRRTGSSA